MTLSSPTLDTVVIGAGPAGVGTGLALSAVTSLTLGVVERGSVGETFRRWPGEQRFLTPSFTGNGFGATDLNAVHPKTSPAFSLGIDYPSGAEYARYLGSVVKHFGLPVLGDTEVIEVRTTDDGFTVYTNRGPMAAHTLVWAGGEFHAPASARFNGSTVVDHSSTDVAWSRREGRVVVIGGYESGIDIACHHVALGATVTVLDPEHPWDAATGSDPSFNLAPRSQHKLARAKATGRLTLSSDGMVVAVKPASSGTFSVSIAGLGAVLADSRPILATGFGPGLGPVSRMFARRDDGWPELDANDESTITPGLFLSGPSVRHAGLKFCFVYKFRQRYAHIARVIGERLGKDCDALEQWRDAGMLTDDLSCCAVECPC
ncbi:MAG: NAD(P)-binding domain-containing protein [Microbacteriaceae bacterium]|nr:NAD(P)-binding domain-containing protein [Microbacteriaceae bacterium]